MNKEGLILKEVPKPPKRAYQKKIKKVKNLKDQKLFSVLKHSFGSLSATLKKSYDNKSKVSLQKFFVIEKKFKIDEENKSFTINYPPIIESQISIEVKSE